MFQAKLKYCPVYFGVLLYSSVYGMHEPVWEASLSQCWTVFFVRNLGPKTFLLGPFCDIL